MSAANEPRVAGADLLPEAAEGYVTTSERLTPAGRGVAEHRCRMMSSGHDADAASAGEERNEIATDLEHELAERLEREALDPPEEFRRQSLINSASVYEEADADPVAWWAKQARAPHSEAPDPWGVGGVGRTMRAQEVRLLDDADLQLDRHDEPDEPARQVGAEGLTLLVHQNVTYGVPGPVGRAATSTFSCKTRCVSVVHA